MRYKRKIEVVVGCIRFAVCMGVAMAVYALMTIAERIEEMRRNG